jgi:hypothetical protein
LLAFLDRARGFFQPLFVVVCESLDVVGPHPKH